MAITVTLPTLHPGQVGAYRARETMLTQEASEATVGRMSESGIYSIDGPSGQYIGSAKNFSKRKEGHFQALRSGNHHSRHLQRAYNKHGRDAFTFRVMLVCGVDALIDFEQRCLDEFRPAYNGTLLAVAPSKDPEVAKRIARSNTGKKQSPEQVAKRVAARAGYLHAEGVKKAIGAGNRGKKRTPEQVEANRQAPKLSGPDHPQYGKAIPDWHKRLLSRVHAGKTISEEVRRKTSQTMRGMNSGAANPMARAVVCLGSDLRFGSVKEATDWLRVNGHPGANSPSISSACKGQREAAYGHRWAYEPRP